MTFKGFLRHEKLGWLAVVGPLYALSSIALSIYLSPWFTWRHNAISDLGVHEVAPIFNVSLIVCGILCAIFAAGMMLRMKSFTGKAGFTLMLMASISLIGIGIFTEDYSPYHFIFSVAFFVFLLMASLELAPWFMLSRRTRYLGAASIFVTMIGVLGWAYHAVVGWGSNVAIPEVLTFVPGAVWFAMIGHWQIRENKRKRNK